MFQTLQTSLRKARAHSLLSGNASPIYLFKDAANTHRPTLNSHDRWSRSTHCEDSDALPGTGCCCCCADAGLLCLPDARRTAVRMPKCRSVWNSPVEPVGFQLEPLRLRSKKARETRSNVPYKWFLSGSQLGSTWYPGRS